ncbi:MAG: hypothetical protein H5U38_10525 [Calditrichaeota bacterium]|nr:hypothetical protein [Calditrichota bacterium]
MSRQLSGIKWGWVLLGAVIAVGIAIFGVFAAVTGYAFHLAFQVRGAPDQQMINQFAARTSPVLASVLMGIGALLGGLLAARKGRPAAVKNGVAVGVLTALVGLISDLLMGPDLWTAVAIALAVGGGWVAGQLGRGRA